MRLQEKQKTLEKELIDNLCSISKHPDGWLPHTVYVEEEGEDESHNGIPVYTAYKLEDFHKDGTCVLYNEKSGERFHVRHLHEINVDWLVTVWERYLELCCEQDVWENNAIAFLAEHTDKSRHEISSFVENLWNKSLAYTDNLKRFLGKGEKEVWIFTFPLEDYDRDVPTEKIIADYKEPYTEIRKMTPEEFVEMINDEMFDDLSHWVRVVELPK